MYSLGMLIIVTNYLIPSSKKAKPPRLYQVSLLEMGGWRQAVAFVRSEPCEVSWSWVWSSLESQGSVGRIRCPHSGILHSGSKF